MAYKFGNSIEDICIKKIEAGIRAIKLGTKTPQEANVGVLLNKLNETNQGMYQDLLTKYMEAKVEYDKKQINKDSKK